LEGNIETEGKKKVNISSAYKESIDEAHAF